jgi:hypothetical protein
VSHQIIERVQCQLLAATPSQLVRKPGCCSEASLVQELLRILSGHTRAASPPLLADNPVDDVGLPSEGDIAAGHFRRHQRHQIVRPEDPIQEGHQRLSHHGGAFELRVIGVEKDHEHACPRIAGGFAAAAQAVHLGPRRGGGGRPNHHMLEVLDLLRNSVFEDFQVGGLQIGNRHTVAGGVHVHAHIVRAGPENWLAPVLRILGRQRGNDG